MNLRALQGFRLYFVPDSHHVSHDCRLIPVSDAADACGRCALQLGQFRCQHGLLLFDCGLLSTLRVASSERTHFALSMAVVGLQPTLAETDFGQKNVDRLWSSPFDRLRPNRLWPKLVFQSFGLFCSKKKKQDEKTKHGRTNIRRVGPRRVGAPLRGFRGSGLNVGLSVLGVWALWVQKVWQKTQKH